MHTSLLGIKSEKQFADKTDEVGLSELGLNFLGG